MMIKIKLLLSATLACLAIVASTPACPETSSPPAKKMQVVVLESPPFVMKTDQGFTGFAIDLWEESAETHGLGLRISGSINPPRASSISVTTGKSDVAVTELTINAERMERMDFSQPWFDAGLQMMIYQAPAGWFLEFLRAA